MKRRFATAPKPLVIPSYFERLEPRCLMSVALNPIDWFQGPATSNLHAIQTVGVVSLPIISFPTPVQLPIAVDPPVVDPTPPVQAPIIPVQVTTPGTGVLTPVFNDRPTVVATTEYPLGRLTVATLSGITSNYSNLADFHVDINYGAILYTGGIVSRNPDGTYSITTDYNWAKLAMAQGASTVTIHFWQASPETPDIRSDDLTLTTPIPLPQNSSNSLNLTVAAGQTFSGVIGSIDAASLSGHSLNNLLVSISWGDSAPTMGTLVANDHGGYDLVGTHTYSSAGTFNIIGTVESEPIFDPQLSSSRPPLNPGQVLPPIVFSLNSYRRDLLANVFATIVVSVPIASTPPVSSPTPVYPPQLETVDFQPILGSPTSGSIAQIFIPTPDEVSHIANGDYHVQITMDDGTIIPANFVLTADGRIHIDIVYAATDLQEHNATIHFWEDPSAAPGGNSFDLTLTTIIQAIPPANAMPSSPSAGQTFTGIVGTFGDYHPYNIVEELPQFVSIDWADGTTSQGTLVQNQQGGYDVIGTHTYASAGTYNIRMVEDFVSPNEGTPYTSPIVDPGQILTTTITVQPANNTVQPVSNAPVLQLQPINVTGTQNIATTFNAIFTDANSTLSVSGYTATIDWGDGTTSTGTITQADAFTVSSDHTYATSGQFDITLTISTADNRSAVTRGLATITPTAADPTASTLDAQAALQSNALSSDPLALNA